MSIATHNSPTVDNGVKVYSFTLVLAGANALTDDVMNDLYEAGCDDATPCVRAKNFYLGFDRQAHSQTEAIESAIADVEKTGLEVVRVVPPEGDVIDAFNKMLRAKRMAQELWTSASETTGDSKLKAELIKRLEDLAHSLLEQLEDE